MDPTKHNYYKKLMRLYEQGELPTACLAQLDIYHDDWCGVHKGGYCNCDPDLQVRALPRGISVGSDPIQEAAGSKRDSFDEETRPLEPPTEPCPHCGDKEFTIWQKPNDPTNMAISCNGCGAVLSSTHPLDPDDRPMRRP